MRASRPDTLISLRECKIRAAVLLKELRGADRLQAYGAAEQLQVLPAFAADDPEAILARRDAVRRKHALAAVAAELGYPNWAACKRRLETPAAARVDTGRFFAVTRGFLNRWFARYDEARASLDAHGGYLFPYGRQFFVCEWAFVEALGIDPHDPDWERIGRDWVRPADDEARDRLERKLVALGYGGREAE